MAKLIRDIQAYCFVKACVNDALCGNVARLDNINVQLSCVFDCRAAVEEGA
jgi:hypothetical protein